MFISQLDTSSAKNDRTIEPKHFRIYCGLHCRLSRLKQVSIVFTTVTRERLIVERKWTVRRLSAPQKNLIKHVHINEMLWYMRKCML